MSQEKHGIKLILKFVLIVQNHEETFKTTLYLEDYGIIYSKKLFKE